MIPAAASAVLFLAVLAPFAAAQDGSVSSTDAKELRLEDMFGFSRRLAPFPRVQRWFDDRRLMVFAPTAAGAAFPSWILQPSDGGRRSLLIGPDDILPAFERLAIGPTQEQIIEALSSPSAYLWTEDHRQFVVDVAGDLFRYHLAHDEVVRLTHGPSAEVGADWAPDGRSVAFSRDYNLFVAAADGTSERPLTAGGYEDDWFGRLDWVYQEELYGRGNFKGFWWSPDSARLAFLRFDESSVREFTLVSDTPTRPIVERENYPKAGDPNPVVQLGVVPVGGGDAVWFDLSRYGTADLLIVRVTWHPDGKKVYFQVQEREQKWLELLAGDVATGDCELVLREESPTWVEAGPEPEWLDGGERFIWRSERDGFSHLYLYEQGGQLVRRLTEGLWEVDEYLGTANDQVFFVGDRGDVKQNHLFSVALDGGQAPRRLTKHQGWNGVAANASFDRFVVRFSSVRVPRRDFVVDVDGNETTVLVETAANELASYGLATPEFVQVSTRDGFVMEAMLIKPAGYVPGRRYPVVAHVYGGPHTPRVVDRWRDRDMIWHQIMAKKGYLIWICDNQSASGKGRISADACYRNMGTSELRDQEDGIDWLINEGYADPERIAIWGWSYGGYLTLTALLRSDKWAAGIAVNPVSDWSFYDTVYTERYMGMPQTNVEGYARNSLLTKAEGLSEPLLLVAATMDDNVHMQNSLSLMHALQKARKPFRFMAYPRVRHGIGDREKQLHLFQMMADFVDEHLAAESDGASTDAGGIRDR